MILLMDKFTWDEEQQLLANERGAILKFHVNTFAALLLTSPSLTPLRVSWQMERMCVCEATTGWPGKEPASFSPAQCLYNLGTGMKF